MKDRCLAGQVVIERLPLLKNVGRSALGGGPRHAVTTSHIEPNSFTLPTYPKVLVFYHSLIFWSVLLLWCLWCHVLTLLVQLHPTTHVLTSFLLLPPILFFCPLFSLHCSRNGGSFPQYLELSLHFINHFNLHSTSIIYTRNLAQ